MRRASALAAALLLGLAVAPASAGETADALVVDAMDAPAHVTYSGVVEQLRIGQDGSEASVFRIEHAPGLTRKQYTSPPDLDGDAVVTKGDDSYAIDAARHRIVFSENAALDDPTALAANYILLRANYRAVMRGADVVAGRETDVVALVNDYTHQVEAVVRIDRVTKLVLDKQEFGAGGSMIEETRFEQVAYPASIPSSDFAMPAGYTTVDGPTRTAPSEAIPALVAEAGFAANPPLRLPHGFSAVEGKLVAIEGVRTLHVLYSDGIRTVSLFESGASAAVDMSKDRPQPTHVGDRDAQYAQSGTTTILVWSDGTRRYALVGTMKLEELQRFARSIGS